MPIKVIIVDDDSLIIDSLKLILDLDSEIEVSAVCRNGDEAFKTVMQFPDISVILMDIMMPVCNGIEATKKIHEINSHVKIIVLTTFDDDEYIFEAIKHGAKGYMLKNSPPDKIIEAVKIVHSGNLLVHPTVAAKLPNLLMKEKKATFDSTLLTDIELNIMKYVSKGLSNKEISKVLFLAEGTVKNKITEVLNKLGLRDRTQLAIHYLNKSEK